MAIYPKELTDLVEEFLSDGIITAKEREVLLRKARGLRIDAEEFDLYIDAQQHKADQAADSAVRRKKGQSCPYCGGSVPQLADACPHCGQHITVEASDELKEIIDNLEDALVDLKSSRDFEESKANVERYARKARMYYSNNPKIKPLLAEVNAEMAIAEKKYAKQNVWYKKHPYIASFLVVLLVGVMTGAITAGVMDDPEMLWVVPFVIVFLGGMVIYGMHLHKDD